MSILESWQKVHRIVRYVLKEKGEYCHEAEILLDAARAILGMRPIAFHTGDRYQWQ